MADWYAFEEIEPAFNRTKDLLMPFDAGTWGRLLILVIFTGAGFNLPGGPWDSGASSSNDFSHTGDRMNADLQQAIDQPVTGLSVGAGAEPLIIFTALVFVGLAFLLFFISSVMSLVYYQSLLDDDVRIRKNFNKHFRKGFSYFGFRLTIGLSLILAFAIPLLLIAGDILVAGLFLLLPALSVLLVSLILLGLTDNFVLPRMIEEDENVVEAWKAVYSGLKAEWKQVGVYLLVKFGLKVLAGMVNIFWLILTLLAAVIVFGIIALPLYLITPALAALPAVVGIITWIIALISIQIPIQTYMRYYAVLNYHDLTA